MRIPDCGPFGETLLEASEAAIFFALFLNSPFGGCVESVFTVLIHLLFAWRGIISPRPARLAWGLPSDIEAKFTFGQYGSACKGGQPMGDGVWPGSSAQLEDSFHWQPFFAGPRFGQGLLKFPHEVFPLLDLRILAVGLGLPFK